MVVQTTTDRIIKSISYTEGRVLTAMAEYLDKDKVELVISTVADKAHLSRSVAVNVLTKLNAAGVLEARSLGMRGMVIKVLNREALDEILKAFAA